MFDSLSASKKLKKLAENPFDLTKSGGVSSHRIETMFAQKCGLRLIYGTERVDEDTLKALEELTVETHAIEKMATMQQGDVINEIKGFPSEKRSVLHTAMRDQFDNPQKSEVAKSAAHAAKKELDKLKVFLSGEACQKFKHLIVIGIGGSELGPKAVYHALEFYKREDRTVHFISNVDPDETAKVMKEIERKDALVIVISKSGNTIETRTNEELARRYFHDVGLQPKNHFVSVTGEKSPMDNPERYLASFYIWDFVGGRYSVTSMVGGVILGFLIGFENFMEFLKGAHDMDQIALNAPFRENLPLLSACIGIWNRNFLGYNSVAILPYSQALSRWPAHLQQCDMESNGKRIDKQGAPVTFKTGPVIWGEPGTNGQHSFYQLIHQGTDIVPCEFIGFEHSQYGQDITVDGTTSQNKLLANLFAQSIALATGQKSDNPNKVFPGNRPNRILMAHKLDPYTMGTILSYYENKIAFQGFIWDINSFDQEGVQLGKVLADKVTDAMMGKLSKEEFPAGHALIDSLKKIC